MQRQIVSCFIIILVTYNHAFLSVRIELRVKLSFSTMICLLTRASLSVSFCHRNTQEVVTVDVLSLVPLIMLTIMVQSLCPTATLSASYSSFNEHVIKVSLSLSKYHQCLLFIVFISQNCKLEKYKFSPISFAEFSMTFNSNP